MVCWSVFEFAGLYRPVCLSLCWLVCIDLSVVPSLCSLVYIGLSVFVPVGLYRSVWWSGGLSLCWLICIGVSVGLSLCSLVCIGLSVGLCAGWSVMVCWSVFVFIGLYRPICAS